jgi:hypothetical protein
MLDKLSNPYAYNHFYANNDIKAMSLTLDAELQDINQQLLDANLPIFTSKEGEWLDYIAWSLYGLKRPTIALGRITPQIGTIGYFPMISFGFLGFKQVVLPQSELISDDCFKRMLIWHTFVGDGWFFNLDFFKRKIKRFIQDDMHGVVDNTFDISINLNNKIISIPDCYFSQRLKWLYLSGFLSVPLGMKGFDVELY